jgi:hypothetical protein
MSRAIRSDISHRSSGRLKRTGVSRIRLRSVADRLLRIFFAMLANRTLYDPSAFRCLPNTPSSPLVNRWGVPLCGRSAPLAGMTMHCDIPAPPTQVPVGPRVRGVAGRCPQTPHCRPRGRSGCVSEHPQRQRGQFLHERTNRHDALSRCRTTAHRQPPSTGVRQVPLQIAQQRQIFPPRFDPRVPPAGEVQHDGPDEPEDVHVA